MPTASRHAEMETVCPVPTCSTTTSGITSSSPPTVRRDRGSARGRSRHACTFNHELATIEPADFEGFAAVLRRELAPATLLEQILIDRVILSAWRLRRISEVETRQARAGREHGELPPIRRAVLRAESSLETALVLLESARTARRPGWGHAARLSTKLDPANFDRDSLDPPVDDLPDLSNEWTRLPDPDDDSRDEVDHDDLDGRAWRGRLVYDDNVSTTSPVVRGTWVTVRQVVSLIVDGWTWSDVLHTHPELTEDDIRVCLAYTVEQDDGE
jgi:uncharacterized protein (DUF433 family)